MLQGQTSQFSLCACYKLLAASVGARKPENAQHCQEIHILGSFCAHALRVNLTSFALLQTALERLAIVEKERQEAIEQLQGARRRSGSMLFTIGYYPGPIPHAILASCANVHHCPVEKATMLVFAPK